MKLKDYRTCGYIGLASCLLMFLIAAIFGITGDRNTSRFFMAIGGLLLFPLMILNIVIFKCPKCKTHLGKGFKQYCSNCGCKIDPEDELGG